MNINWSAFEAKVLAIIEKVMTKIMKRYCEKWVTAEGSLRACGHFDSEVPEGSWQDVQPHPGDLARPAGRGARTGLALSSA